MPIPRVTPPTGIPLSQQQLQALTALCARFQVRRLSLFGSAVRGSFESARSDFDLSVDFDEPVGMGLADQFFGFQEEAARLLGRTVDLVERSAIRNPYLRRSIEAEEVVLYGA